jgi:hypothetical protein
VLLVTYVATTYVIRRQAIEHGVQPQQVDDALKGAGFGDSFPVQLMRFAQALVPLLPGVTTLFLTGIS